MPPSPPAPELTALVVADGALAGALAAVVRGHGYGVAVANDAVRLAEAFGEAHVTRVVAALDLPWAPGASLVPALRKRFPNAGFVAVGNVAAPGVLRVLVEGEVVDVVPASLEGVAALDTLLAAAAPARVAVAPSASGVARPAPARAAPAGATTPTIQAATASSAPAPAEPPPAPAEPPARAERFAAEVAHDLREPLRASRLWLERLDAKLAAKDIGGAQTVAAKLYDAAARMEDLVEGALADLRHGLPPTDARSHADRVLDEVIEQLESLLKETGGVVTRDALPEVGLHAHQLRQLLQNLVANALRYGGTPPRVHVSAAAGPDRWTLSVADNGPGVPEDKRETIFKPLVRLAGPESAAGHGLGLAICRRVVERMGGRIWVEPGKKGGSVFRVTVPLAPVAADAPDTITASSKRGEA